MIAFAILFLSPGEPFALLEYMATDLRWRSRGVGAALFNMSLAELGARTILVEVDSDREASADSAIRSRRKDFYRKLGCRQVAELGYVMPMVAGIQPPKMDLLLRPGSDSGPIAKATLRAWLEEIYAAVYGQVLPDSRIDAMLERVADRVALSGGPQDGR